MNNKKTIVIGMVLLLIPSLMATITVAQEETDVIQIGSWQVRRLTNLVFEPMIVGYNTTTSIKEFYIEDQGGGIMGIIPGIMMRKGVWVVYENATDNRTALSPDASGIYTLEMPQTGNYTVIVMTAANINIPLIGNLLFPGSTSAVVFHRGYAMPYAFMGICCVVICIAGVGGYAWKKIKDKRRNLP